MSATAQSVLAPGMCACACKKDRIHTPSHHCECRCHCFCFPIVCQILQGEGGRKKKLLFTKANKCRLWSFPVWETHLILEYKQQQGSLWLSGFSICAFSNPQQSTFQGRREAIKLLAGFLGTKRCTAHGGAKSLARFWQQVRTMKAFKPCTRPEDAVKTKFAAYGLQRGLEDAQSRSSPAYVPPLQIPLFKMPKEICIKIREGSRPSI